MSKYGTVSQRVYDFNKAIEHKSEQAVKFEKSDPELSRDLTTLVTGMKFAYQILRAEQKKGWTN